MWTTKGLVFASLLLVVAAGPVGAAPVGAVPLTALPNDVEPEDTPMAAMPPMNCAQVCCPCDCAAALEADDRVAREALAIGMALFVPAYVAGTAYAWTLPGAVHSV